jgi:hypothetical protein
VQNISRMNNRYAISMLAAAFATTLLNAQQSVPLSNTVNLNFNVQQQVTNIPAQTPQRAANGNSSRQPSLLLLNSAVLSNVLIVQTQSGGPNGPNGTARPATPQRQAAAPPRGVSRPNTGTTAPQRRPATPQRASNPATPQRVSNPGPQRQVIIGGPNVSGVIAQPVQFGVGPNGVGNPMPININVNPILSNTIPVQAIINDNNEPINVSRGNQNFVFELNNDNNRGNINVNVEMPQLQAPQINLPQVNKVELPEINMPKVTLPKIKTGGSGGSGGGKMKKSPQFNFKSNWKSFKRDFRHKWRKFARKRGKMRYRVAECFFSGC